MKAEAVKALKESQQRLALVRGSGGGGGRMRTEYRSRVEWLIARDIDVKEGAQRPFDANHAARLAKDFDPDALGYPFVAAIENKNGVERYYAIDGQHRVAAVRIALGEDQQIQCEVVRGIDIPHAAALFVARNTRRNVRSIDQFVANVTAQHPDHLGITKILADLGLRVAGGSQSDGVVHAVTSLLKIYRMDPEDTRGHLLRRVLTLCISAWGRGADSFMGDLLSGLSLVLVRHGGELEAEALERKLRAHTGGALGLVGKARSFRESLGGSIAQSVARAVIASYNSGRTKYRLPQWGEKADR